MNTSELNQGIYSDKDVAIKWDTWVKGFKPGDTRDKDIYPYITNWIEKNQPANVLEIGSGQGVCSEKISFGATQYVGIEPSKHLREFATNTYPQRTFLAGTAERLPFNSDSFDAAFSVFVWLHLSDLDAAAKELSRVLAPKGSFTIVTANPDMYDLWKAWHSDIVMNGKEMRGNMKRFPNHSMYLHTMKEILDSFTNAGLTITDRTYCGREEDKEAGPGFAVIISGNKA